MQFASFIYMKINTVGMIFDIFMKNRIFHLIWTGTKTILIQDA